MVVEILCDARRRKRSLLCVNEHFGDRRTRAKFTRQNDFLICAKLEHYLITVQLAFVQQD